jgi:hypothetical protein
MRPFSKAKRTLALATVLAMLGGCSEYLDRRETIALSGGNAVATNVVTHMVDPWPRASANRNIAFNGARIESAFERYRTNRVTAPRGIGTSNTYQDATPAAAGPAPVGSATTAPAAPVK